MANIFEQTIVSSADEIKMRIAALGYSWKVHYSATTGYYHSYVDTGSPDYAVGYSPTEYSEAAALASALAEARRKIADG